MVETAISGKSNGTAKVDILSTREDNLEYKSSD